MKNKTIKQRMEEAKISPVHVAFHCKVTVATVYNWIKYNRIFRSEHEKLFNELLGRGK